MDKDKQKGAANSYFKLTKWIEKAPICKCNREPREQIAFICMQEGCKVNLEKMKNKEFRIGQENDVFCLKCQLKNLHNHETEMIQEVVDKLQKDWTTFIETFNTFYHEQNQRFSEWEPLIKHFERDIALVKNLPKGFRYFSQDRIRAKKLLENVDRERMDVEKIVLD